MKILHTSDWHLGKKLEGRTRIEEQYFFTIELERIVEKENIDIVIIAGDIYDTYNPPAEAEKLFYDCVKKISKNGKVGIIIISGNHDSPQRLGAISTLARDFGVIIYEKAFQKIPEGKYGDLNIYRSVEGGIFIEKDGKRIYLYALPYPSETSLAEDFSNIKFHERIREILKKGVELNEENIPTVLTSHIYVAGSMGEGEESLELGGARAISLKDLPKADYIALGHVHKPMEFKEKNAVYCGSPLEYRVTENRFDKKIYIIELKNGKTDIKSIILNNHKPIKEYTVEGIERAIELSKELKNKDEWIYLKIKIESPIKNSDIKKIKENKNILEITPIFSLEEDTKKGSLEYSEENIEEAFIEFFKKESDGLYPSENVKRLFLELLEDVNKI